MPHSAGRVVKLKRNKISLAEHAERAEQKRNKVRVRIRDAAA